MNIAVPVNFMGYCANDFLVTDDINVGETITGKYVLLREANSIKLLTNISDDMSESANEN